jgi:hypothetical protein
MSRLLKKIFTIHSIQRPSIIFIIKRMNIFLKSRSFTSCRCPLPLLNINIFNYEGGREAFLPTPPNPRGRGWRIGLVLLQENNSGKLLIFQIIFHIIMSPITIS